MPVPLRADFDARIVRAVAKRSKDGVVRLECNRLRDQINALLGSACLKCNYPEEMKSIKVGRIKLKHFYVELSCLNELALLMKEQAFFELRLDRRCKWLPRLRNLLRFF